jgi:hypothetical protein
VSKLIGAALMVAIYERFRLKPIPPTLRGAILKRFIVYANIGEDSIIRTGKVQQHLLSLIKASSVECSEETVPIITAKTEL